VARLYRATELLAQTRLNLQYGLNTSDLDTTKLPEPLREPYAARCDPDGKLRLGLQAAYGLLGDLGDPLGTAFISVSGPLNNALVRRNSSILAHGSAPVGQTEYRDLHTQLRALIDAALQELLSRWEDYREVGDWQRLMSRHDGPLLPYEQRQRSSRSCAPRAAG